MKYKRITWLDGIKGLACIAVMWHHFILSFLPLLYSENISAYSANAIEKRIQQTPLLFWLNGDFMVMLFLTISGIVISRKTIEIGDKNKLSEVIIKRYFRLMLPLVPVAIVTYIFICFRWFGNYEAGIISSSTWLQTCHEESMSFLQFIYETVISTWYDSNADFGLSCVFWMMPAMFRGSFLAIILGIIAWKVKTTKAICIYFILAAVMILIQPLYVPFCLGAAFSVCYENHPEIFDKKLIGIISFIAGCFLGGYPTGISPTNIYKYLDFLPDYVITYLFWHLAGAILIIYGVANLNGIQQIFSKSFAIFLGKISYSVYIWHTFILCTVSSYLYILLNNLNYDKNKIIIIIFFITNFAVLILSYLYSKHVERTINVFLEKLIYHIIA